MAPRQIVLHLALVGFGLALLASIVISIWLEVHGRIGVIAP